MEKKAAKGEVLKFTKYMSRAHGSGSQGRWLVCSTKNIESKECPTGRPEHLHLSTENIDNSSLALMLASGVWGGDVNSTLVHLQSGPMVQDDGDSRAWAYFPVDALIGLVPVHSAGAAVALVGRHGCVLLPHAQGAPVRAHVVSPGRAYRLDWDVVQKDPDRFAPWLWHAASAAQSLIGQMAQWSFCAKHHSPSQHLASWLLYGLAQSPNAELTVSLQGLPLGIQTVLASSSSAAAQAIDSRGYSFEEGCLRTTGPAQLEAQACSCHTRMALPKSAPF